MSVRRAPELEAAATATALPSPTMPPPPMTMSGNRLAAAVAPTGCGMSVKFGGATLPCGFLLSYGTERTLANTYVLTGKTKYSLHSTDTLAACTTSHPAPTEIMSVKTALYTNMETPIYRDVYRYSVGIQNATFDASIEMERMGVVDWSARMVGGGLDAAYEAVHHSCEAAFGANNYALYAFRVGG